MKATVVIGAVLAVAICALVGLVWLESRYGPIDPTGPGWKALVLNDSGSTVRVRSGAENLPLAPGASDVFVSPGPGQLQVTYEVVDDSGSLVGCLPVKLDKSKTVRVRVSAIQRC